MQERTTYCSLLAWIELMLHDRQKIVLEEEKIVCHWVVYYFSASFFKRKKKGLFTIGSTDSCWWRSCLRTEELVEEVEHQEDKIVSHCITMLFSSTTLVAVVAAVWCSRAGTGVNALGCKGGDTFHGGGDGCNLNSVTCTQEACEEEMGGVWTEECESRRVAMIWVEIPTVLQ